MELTSLSCFCVTDLTSLGSASAVDDTSAQAPDVGLVAMGHPTEVVGVVDAEAEVVWSTTSPTGGSTGGLKGQWLARRLRLSSRLVRCNLSLCSRGKGSHSVYIVSMQGSTSTNTRVG